jgi:hypothetical protein
MPDEIRLVPPTWRERLHDRRRDRKQRRAWRRERRKGDPHVRRAAQEAGTRSWERQDFFNKD